MKRHLNQVALVLLTWAFVFGISPGAQAQDPTSKYTFPKGFDVKRAGEFGKLIIQAYGQLKAANEKKAWSPPSGYEVVLPQFTATEPQGINKILNQGLLKEQLSQFPNDPIKLGEIIKSIMTKKLPFGFIVRNGTDVTVVIRGTITPQEWIDDLKAAPVQFLPDNPAWGKTTSGFKSLYSEMIAQILPVLRDNLKNGDSLYVTGHSLGGALAHLVSAGLSEELKPKLNQTITT